MILANIYAKGASEMQCPVCRFQMTLEDDCYHCGECGNVEGLCVEW